MKLTYNRFISNKEVEFGQIRTSIGIVSITGEWGGGRLRFFIYDDLRKDYVVFIDVDETTWNNFSGKMPQVLTFGEGTHIKVRLLGATDPSLKVIIREVRRGRRGN